ncbi:MAG: DUF7577 domain-containing protein [Candidatus Bathyarchaeia archaeon]
MAGFKPKSWRCPSCGHVNPPSHFFFCRKCGFRNIATYG